MNNALSLDWSCPDTLCAAASSLSDDQANLLTYSQSELPNRYPSVKLNYGSYHSNHSIIAMSNWVNAKPYILCGCRSDHGIKFCKEYRYCERCAYHRSLSLYNRYTTSYRKSPYWYHITYSYTSNVNIMKCTKEEYLGRWSQARAFIKSMCKKGFLTGAVMADELSINGIADTAVFPHTHSVVTSDSPAIPRYIRMLAKKMKSIGVDLHCRPITSEDQMLRTVRYPIKPIDLKKQYASELPLYPIEQLNEGVLKVLDMCSLYEKNYRKIEYCGILDARCKRSYIGSKPTSPKKRKKLKVSNTSSTIKNMTIPVERAQQLMHKLANLPGQPYNLYSGEEQPVQQQAPPQKKTHPWLNAGLIGGGLLGAGVLADGMFNKGQYTSGAMDWLKNKFSGGSPAKPVPKPAAPPTLEQQAQQGVQHELQAGQDAMNEYSNNIYNNTPKGEYERATDDTLSSPGLNTGAAAASIGSMGVNAATSAYAAHNAARVIPGAQSVSQYISGQEASPIHRVSDSARGRTTYSHGLNYGDIETIPTKPNSALGQASQGVEHSLPSNFGTPTTTPNRPVSGAKWSPGPSGSAQSPSYNPGNMSSRGLPGELVDKNPMSWLSNMGKTIGSHVPKPLLKALGWGARAANPMFGMMQGSAIGNNSLVQEAAAGNDPDNPDLDAMAAERRNDKIFGAFLGSHPAGDLAMTGINATLNHANNDLLGKANMVGERGQVGDQLLNLYKQGPSAGPALAKFFKYHPGLMNSQNPLMDQLSSVNDQADHATGIPSDSVNSLTDSPALMALANKAKAYLPQGPSTGQSQNPMAIARRALQQNPYMNSMHQSSDRPAKFNFSY